MSSVRDIICVKSLATKIIVPDVIDHDFLLGGDEKEQAEWRRKEILGLLNHYIRELKETTTPGLTLPTDVVLPATPKEKTMVLIFCGGKCGSTSLYKTLETYRIPCLRVHNIDHFLEEYLPFFKRNTPNRPTTWSRTTFSIFCFNSTAPLSSWIRTGTHWNERCLPCFKTLV